MEDGSCDPGTITGDPNLGPLATNGGPTQTHALLAGSPAIDAVTDGSCPPPMKTSAGWHGPTCNGGNGSDTGANCEPFNQ